MSKFAGACSVLLATLALAAFAPRVYAGSPSRIGVDGAGEGSLVLPFRSPVDAMRMTAIVPGSGAYEDPSPPAAQPAASMAQAGSEATPSSGKAMLLSLLLPGAGELSLGSRGRATGFFLAEGAIWAHFVGWRIAGHLRRENYIEQAQLNAGVGTGDAEDEYWRLVGQYPRSSGTGPESYEEDLRREARDLYPFDLAAQDAYVAELLPTGDRAWEWRTESLRQSYRETRETANRAYHRSKYSIAAAIVNRVASVIDVRLLSRRHRAAAASDLEDDGVHVHAEALPDGGGRIILRRRF